MNVYFNKSQNLFKEFETAPSDEWVLVGEALPAPTPAPNWQGFIDGIADLYRVGEQRNFPLFASLYHLVMRCLDRQVTRDDLEWLTFQRHIQLAAQELTATEEQALSQILNQNHMGGIL